MPQKIYDYFTGAEFENNRNLIMIATCNRILYMYVYEKESNLLPYL